MATKNTVSMLIRPTPKLRKSIGRAAKYYGVSMNQFIISAIRESVAKYRKDKSDITSEE